MKFSFHNTVFTLFVVSLLMMPVNSLFSMDEDYVSPSLVRVFYTDRSEIRTLSDAGACIVASGPGYVDVIVSSKPVKGDPVDMLVSQSKRVDVLEKNLDVQAERFRNKADLGLYHTFEEVVAKLKAYEQNYSDIAKLVELGKSYEGRPVYALKISDNVDSDENEPGFFICGMHHSREWIAVEVPLALADTILTTYASDPAIQNLVSSREIWIVPVQNPDGYVYSTTQYKMWRKNRRPQEGGRFGADPNRNYMYEWGGAGASTYPGSDTYRGPSAASEPITQIIQNFAKSHTNLVGSISFHSYGKLILWPWSYTYDPAPDDEALSVLAKGMAKHNRYAPKQSSDLYPSSGDFDDYMYGVCGLASFTIELARTFIPSESEIQPICEKNVKALLWFIENGANPFPVVNDTMIAESSPSRRMTAAQFSDKLATTVLEAAEQKDYDAIRSFVSTATDEPHYRIVLKTLFRKLSMDDSEEASALTLEVKELLTR